MERSSPLSGGAPPRQGTHVLAERSDIVELILPSVGGRISPPPSRPPELFGMRKERAPRESGVLVASDWRRRPLDERILGCSGYPIQTALMILVILLVTLALLAAVGTLYQAIGTWRDRRRFPPPGQLVRVNKGRMHIHVTGKGTPTVVFESGMGASCLSWTLVQPQVAQFARAVSYDRAGHGWCDPARKPRTARQIAQELHTLLDATGVPGPYVLVGHSFGGYVNRAFAHLYRNEVVGMVLVDSLHPAEWENPIPEQLRMIEVGLRYAWIAAWLARLGLVRYCLARLARGSPRLGWAAASSLGDLPLVVLSGDHHAAPYTAWQRELAQLSSRGRHLVASDSGHWIHLDHPELVTQAIREVVAAVRSSAQMKASAQTPQQ